MLNRDEEIKLSLVEMRVNANLSRIQNFKQVLNESAWFYNLMASAQSNDIHSKPLVKIMCGKLKIPPT